jgi:hypothetical protein
MMLRKLILHVSPYAESCTAGGCEYMSSHIRQFLRSPHASGTSVRLMNSPHVGNSSHKRWFFCSEAVAQGKMTQGPAAAATRLKIPPAGDSEDEGSRPDAIFLRSVLVASVAGAAYTSWSNGAGMYGSPSTHVMLLKGTPHMRAAGLQRLKKCAESGRHQLEIEENRIPERLVALLMTEADLEVWRELCSTLSVLISGPVSSQHMASLGVCSALSQRLSREDPTYHAAAEPLLQKLAQYSGRD